MELQKNTLRYQRQVARQTAYHEELAEGVLPESQPDIARIVETTGIACIRDWELGADEVTIKCMVRVTVLYMAEEDSHLYRMDLPISFSHRMELRGAAPGCDLLCRCVLVSADARTMGARKVSIRIQTALTSRLYAQTEETYPVGVDDNSCQVQCETIATEAIAAVAYKNFTLVEDIDLPEEIGSPRNLLRAEMQIRPTDIKLMPGRVVVKAEAEVHALCETAKEEYQCLTHKFSFTQMAELPGAEEGLIPTVEFGLRSFELDPALDLSGDSRYLSLSAGVIMNLVLSHMVELSVVTDLYSTRYASTLQRKELHYLGGAENKRYRTSFSDHVEAAVTLRRVLDWHLQTDEAVERLPGETNAVVSAMASVLCEGEDGAYYNIQRRIPLQFEAGMDTLERVDTEITQYAAELSASGGLDLEIHAVLQTDAAPVQQILMVDHVEWGEEYPPDARSRLSAVLRRAAGDETLWAIAKEYRTDVAAIAQANHMDTDSIPSRGELLLIPMKK